MSYEKEAQVFSVFGVEKDQLKLVRGGVHVRL